jgi:hypothetical protein
MERKVVLVLGRAMLMEEESRLILRKGFLLTWCWISRAECS